MTDEDRPDGLEHLELALHALHEVINHLHRYRERSASTRATGTTAMTTATDRRYIPGPYPPDWKHVSVLADRMKVHETTAWNVAYDGWAQFTIGKARRVDMSKFRDVLPETQNIDKITIGQRAATSASSTSTEPER